MEGDGLHVTRQRTGSELRFSLLLFERQHSRDKHWWGRKGCFTQEAGSLEDGRLISKTIFLSPGGAGDI